MRGSSASVDLVSVRLTNSTRAVIAFGSRGCASGRSFTSCVLWVSIGTQTTQHVAAPLHGKAIGGVPAAASVRPEAAGPPRSAPRLNRTAEALARCRGESDARPTDPAV